MLTQGKHENPTPNGPAARPESTLLRHAVGG
jgi:hypothetical protein